MVNQGDMLVIGLKREREGEWRVVQGIPKFVLFLYFCLVSKVHRVQKAGWLSLWLSGQMSGTVCGGLEDRPNPYPHRVPGRIEAL